MNRAARIARGAPRTAQAVSCVNSRCSEHDQFGLLSYVNVSVLCHFNVNTPADLMIRVDGMTERFESCANSRQVSATSSIAA